MSDGPLGNDSSRTGRAANGVEHLIDAHCHLLQLHRAYRVDAHRVLVLAVTNDSHEYTETLRRYGRHPWVRVAIGMHPLHIQNQPEAAIDQFLEIAKTARYVGEVGLDRSLSGAPSFDKQRSVLRRLLGLISRGQFVSMHSRCAASEVAEELLSSAAPPVALHWFSGTTSRVRELLGAGHFFSINPSMVTSATARRIVNWIPPERALIETDAPYTRIAGRTTVPSDVRFVYEYLAAEWQSDIASVARRVKSNFLKLLDSLP